MKPFTAYTRKLGLMLATLVLATLALALVVFFLTAAATAADPIHADDPELTEWVIVTGITGTVSIVDASTDIVYGPVLSGQLGTSSGGVLDVVVTPDGDTALISNFGDSVVFFVDVSNPISPSVITSVTLPFFAEDIALTRDGRFALVTDGGLSSLMASIDVISRTLAYTVSLGALDAQAIDVAPDGTVVLADYLGGRVHTMFPDASGHLTITGSYSYTIGEGADRPWPANVAVAPDGQTVIVCNSFAYNPPTNTRFAVGIFRITAPGVLSFTGAITTLSRAAQSVAFNPAGDKAYLSANGGNPDNNEYDHLAVLDITGPGIVNLNMDRAADLPRMTSGHLFGVDTIAVVNGKAYVAYPGTSDTSNDLRVVDLTDYSVKRLSMFGQSHGVAVIPLRKIFFPLVLRNAP